MRGINFNSANDPNMSDEINAQRRAVAKEKYNRIKRFRQEASRKAAMANKRIDRLIERGLTDSPAYQKWVKDGSHRFGVRGKDYNQVQSELARLNNFLNAETSTIRGFDAVLKNLAENTGIKYNDLSELRSSASTFFEIASRVEQYYRSALDMGSAIGYQKIWDVINNYVAEERADLLGAGTDIDSATQAIIQALNIFNERERVSDDDMWQVVGLNELY